MALKITRKAYAEDYGPTTGDSIRLGDTNLWIKIEKDYTVYGDELKYGEGKSFRDGMGQNSVVTREHPDVMDLIITNVVVLDYTGIYKCDIGVRDGKIAAIGHAGNPLLQDGVNMIAAVNTECISGEGLIVTAGGIDTHIHYITPDQCYSALQNGVTTHFGGGTGPATGTLATTCTPGEWYIQRMLVAFDSMPFNVGILGKGNGAWSETIAEQIRAGASGIKDHEDWSCTRSSLDNSLKACREYDVQLAIHTDSLNESGFVEHTEDALAGRTVHTFHSEGAGGGHAPDIMELTGYDYVIPSSTNPTLPATHDSVPELGDMLMFCHHLNPANPEDVALAKSRIRQQTINAESVFHDLGIISIVSADSQAMGRAGETVLRTWQMADSMKKQFGYLEIEGFGKDSEYNDNLRAKRYVSKYTINAAMVEGVDEYIGSIEVGKYADLVLWDPKFFGAKPSLVLKCGMIATALMGDANASLATCEPIVYKQMFGGLGKAGQEQAITFVSKYAYEHNVKENLKLQHKVLPCHGASTLKKSDMKWNNWAPKVKVAPRTFEVTVNGKKITSVPQAEIALNRLYWLY